MQKKLGFGLIEILMVMVMLSILYVYAGNTGSSKYKSAKDIAELNWLTSQLPNSLFLATQNRGRDASGILILKANQVLKTDLTKFALSAKTAAGREWDMCSIKPLDQTHLCIRITGTKINVLKDLIKANHYAYIPNASLSKISDTELEVIYDFP